MSRRNYDEGVVYLIGSEVVGVVKIGITRGSVEGRLKSLQTGCPFPLKVFGYFAGYAELEQRLHRTFRPLWMHGEWFELRDKLRDFVFYVEGYAEAGESLMISEDDLDCALHDCVWSGMCYPGMDEAQYDASAIREEWAREYA